MRRVFLALVGIAATAASFFKVQWVDPSMNALTIRASGSEEEVAACLDSSREAKLEFEMRLCRRRGSWLDACADVHTEKRSVSFDSISESYRVVSDRIGDGEDPVARGVQSKRDAVTAAVTAEDVPLALLEKGKEGISKHPRAYIQFRAVFTCKGSVNRTFARLSQILTLGLVNVIESDSGWIDFVVQPSPAPASDPQPN